jgi:hypothetical protein
MDCTYKTNRCDIPLLNIMGITAASNAVNAAVVRKHETKDTITTVFLLLVTTTMNIII